MTDTSSTSQKRSRRRKRASAKSGSETAAEPAAGTKKRGRSRRRRLRRWLFWYPLAVLVIIAMIPLALTLLYRLDGVRPVSTLMVSRAVTGQPVDRQWVDFEDVSPRLYQSVLMSEDGQFCFHHGVDLRELRAVIDDALDGEQVRGASTITMQTARNLFLWNHRSYVRKALEVPLAIWIDLAVPKERIMEIYLNIAEWGPDGQFGIKAAADHHFGRPPDDLTSRQAALLAVTLPNPHVRDPASPGPGLNRVAGIIERRAAQSGAYIGCLTE